MCKSNKFHFFCNMKKIFIFFLAVNKMSKKKIGKQWVYHFLTPASPIDGALNVKFFFCWISNTLDVAQYIGCLQFIKWQQKKIPNFECAAAAGNTWNCNFVSLFFCVHVCVRYPNEIKCGILDFSFHKHGCYVKKICQKWVKESSWFQVQNISVCTCVW